MTALAAGLLETHVDDEGITPGRVHKRAARVILTSVDIPELSPSIVSVARPTPLEYLTATTTVPVHEQTHILPPTGMVAIYSAPMIGSFLNLPFDLITTHAVDNAPVPERVKNANGSVVKSHGEGSVPTPGTGHIITPDTLDYKTVAQAPHVQFAYIIPPGTYVQYLAAKIVINTRLDVRPSKIEATYKALKTDSWQPGLCEPPDVTVHYQASIIVLNMDAILTPEHVALSYAAARVTFGHSVIKESPIDVVCYYAAAQINVDDGPKQHTLTVSTVRGDYSAARVHTLTIQTVIPDILDYAAVAQVPDVHRYIVRSKYGPILEIDRAGRVVELDRGIAIIELTKSEVDE